MTEPAKVPFSPQYGGFRAPSQSTLTAGSYGSDATQGAFTDPTTGGSVPGAGTIPTKAGAKTIAELVMQARDPKNLAKIRTLLVNNGLLDKGVKSISSIQSAWLQILIGASSTQMDPEDYVKTLKAGGFGADTATGGGPTEFPSIYSNTQAESKIIDIFDKVLNREPTADELKTLIPALQKAQKDNPAKQTYVTVGGKRVQTTTGGLDEAQWLTDKLKADPKYKDELSATLLTPASVAQRAKDKAIYDKAIAAAGNDAQKIAQINSSSAYGLNITTLKDKIQSAFDKAGAMYDEATLASLAKQAYDNNLDASPATFQKFIDSQTKFGTSGFKGEAAGYVNDLAKIAQANGLDLNKAFGSQLPSWLEALNKGANIEDYKKIIRDVAKIGMPEKVAKLMDQGIDLQTIYSPYKNMMESVLELPSGSITMDDPTLRDAITSEGEIPLYQFQRNLRQDPRWQYTNSARQEVSGAVNKVLKDFGFQG